MSNLVGFHHGATNPSNNASEEEFAEYTLKFKVPQDWNPMVEAGCIQDCPFKRMIQWGKMCNARYEFITYGDVVCPVLNLLSEVSGDA